MLPPPAPDPESPDLPAPSSPEGRPEGATSAIRLRVGAWVKARRMELGLSQGAMIRELGYVSRNSISNVETGREGLPPKRVYAWADLLQVPREPFFRFVTGDSETLEIGPGSAQAFVPTASELELLASYRKLPLAGQKRVRELLATLAPK